MAVADARSPAGAWDGWPPTPAADVAEDPGSAELDDMGGSFVRVSFGVGGSCARVSMMSRMHNSYSGYD